MLLALRILRVTYITHNACGIPVMLTIFRIRLCPQVFVFMLLLPNDFFLSMHNDVAYHTALDFVVSKKRIILSWILQHQRSTVYNVSYCIGFYSINPFSATACKISGLKSAHILASKQDIWWSCSQSTFNAVHFVQNPPTCSRKGGKKSRNGFKFGTLLVVFRVTARQAWQ